MTQDDTINKKESKKKNMIYLSIDHLKHGNYKLLITLKNKIIKSVKFKIKQN